MKYLVIVGLVAVQLIGSLSSAEDEIVRKPWTKSTVKGSPDPPKPYVPEAVFEDIELANCLELIPYQGRIYAVENAGRIVSFPEKETGGNRQMDEFLNLKPIYPDVTHCYGIAFHPRAEDNQQVFVTYTRKLKTDDGTKLSRFRFEETENGSLKVIPGSEEILLTWRSGGHNGAHLQFGSDGYLYISTGDAAVPSPPDIYQTGQDNSDLLSSILRIDVNARDAGLNYRVPSDNPYVNMENVRPEIWAFGFRNPWKMAFDSQDRLWVGDVGWELWEMIYLVEKGGNYGWSTVEGGNPIDAMKVSPLAPISYPVATHSHSEAASITGGYVYNGDRLPDLKGSYVYGDYETGLIWALKIEGGQAVDHRVIVDSPHKIVTFGLGNDGELYYVHYGKPSSFYRLVPNPKIGAVSDFPVKLSDTGLFRKADLNQVEEGVYEFSVNEPMWQDGATSRHFIGLPGESQIKTGILFHRNGNRRATTSWPADSVLAKTINVGSQPVETQLLYFDGDVWNPYSYQWDKDGKDATLVGSEGTEVKVNAKRWRGGDTYRIGSRAECMRCHTSWNRFTAAFEPMQLGEFSGYAKQSPQHVAVQLGLTDSNFFFKNQSGHLTSSRSGAPLEKRARSWLHANCAHCHRKNGGGSAQLVVNFENSLSESSLLWEPVTRGDFGLDHAKIVVPGAPWRSVLNYRVSSHGSGHMPPLGAREVDPHGANLLWQWVSGMRTESATASIEPGIDCTSAAMALSQSIASGELKGQERADAIANGLATENQNIKSLFERFRSPGERPKIKKLDINQLRSGGGDAIAGSKLLSMTGKLASCFACHQLNGNGGQLGPDLSNVGDRLNRNLLVESLVQPSKTISPEYRLWTLKLATGESHSGCILKEDAKNVEFRSASGELTSIPVKQILERSAQATSLMPEGLLNLLNQQEAADLIAYLESLTAK